GGRGPGYRVGRPAGRPSGWPAAPPAAARTGAAPRPRASAAGGGGCRPRRPRPPPRSARAGAVRVLGEDGRDGGVDRGVALGRVLVAPRATGGDAFPHQGVATRIDEVDV